METQDKVVLEEKDPAKDRWFLTAPMVIIGWTIALYIAKCIFVDKVVGSVVLAGCSKPITGTCRFLDQLFTTDDLGPHLATVFLTVVGFYFGRAAIMEIADKLKR